MKEVCNKSDLESQLQKSKKILALFYASWCPFCRSFLPVFERTSSEQGVNLVLLVKVDDYDNPLWDEYSIEAVPTVILFNEGNVCKRLDARLGCGLSEQQLKQWLEREKS
jgi:thioredoxin 1